MRYLMVSDILFSFGWTFFWRNYNLLISIVFQQAHQKNQAKDTIDVEEPEGMLLLIVRIFCNYHVIAYSENVL